MPLKIPISNSHNRFLIDINSQDSTQQIRTFWVFYSLYDEYSENVGTDVQIKNGKNKK